MTVESFNPVTNPTVSMTEKAQRFIAKNIAKHNALGVLFYVEQSGCSGFRYKLDFVDQVDDSLLSVVINDELTVFVSPQDQAYLSGTVIDLVVEGLNQSIQFLNPNASGTCGCGESFTVN